MVGVRKVSNMPYCRFRNTLEDLMDCRNQMTYGEGEVLSDEEKKAKKDLIELCKEIADDYRED